MAMLTGYFEVSVNFNVENRREKFIIQISIVYPIYSILIRSQNFLCSLRELLMSFPLAHRAERGTRLLISTCVESLYTRDHFGRPS